MEALRAALGADFEVKQRLGRGSMATVYLAREKALGRLVAVKVLLPGRASEETARKRFEREAKAAATLMHPNVVQVFRFGRLADGTPFLVMRFVKGRTLEERLAADGRLSVDLARKVLSGVASALAAAHAQGIVHRDVRPANVLWDDDAQQALLTDFGIAAILASSGEEVTKLTKTGQMIGDPRYMSPEQLMDRDLTELADMYAFGILGYELLTGEGPYKVRSNADQIAAHLNGEARDLKQLRPEVDGSVADLLKRCLNREPNHRPSAERAFAALSGQPGAAGEGALDLQELVKRRVPQFVLGAGGAAAGLLAFVSMLVQMGTLGSVWWDLSLPLAASGFVAAGVVAWFHGERGRQEPSRVEFVLLGAIAVVWLSTTAWILLA
ncbi:MAG: serine/threonine-protein kinase [Longimicrobiales bacterium]